MVGISLQLEVDSLMAQHMIQYKDKIKSITSKILKEWVQRKRERKERKEGGRKS